MTKIKISEKEKKQEIEKIKILLKEIENLQDNKIINEKIMELATRFTTLNIKMQGENSKIYKIIKKEKMKDPLALSERIKAMIENQ